MFLRPTVLFTVSPAHLHYNVFETISGYFVVLARVCLASTLDYIVMQLRKTNREKGYYKFCQTPPHPTPPPPPPIRGSEARLNFMQQTFFAKSGVLREENCRCLMSLQPFPWCVPTGFVYDCYAQGVECNPVCCTIYFYGIYFQKKTTCQMNMPLFCIGFVLFCFLLF